MEYWYVINVKPHKERQVADYLREHKIAVYLPLIHVNPVNPRSSKERPLFPNYLFARVDLEAVGIAAVQWAPGAKRLVEFGGYPAAISDSFIFDLKRRVEKIRAAGGLAFASLASGDRVKITSGPFAGYEAVFDARLDGKERVRVLLELLEKHQRRPRGMLAVELNVGNIQKVKPRR